MEGRTQGEMKFIDRFTRKFLVKWALGQIAGKEHPVVTTANSRVYVTYAHSKGWLTSKKNRLTSTGFGVAASFLK